MRYGYDKRYILSCFVLLCRVRLDKTANKQKSHCLRNGFIYNVLKLVGDNRLELLTSSMSKLKILLILNNLYSIGFIYG